MESGPWVDIGITFGVGLVIATVLWFAIRLSRRNKC